MQSLRGLSRRSIPFLWAAGVVYFAAPFWKSLKDNEQAILAAAAKEGALYFDQLIVEDEIASMAKAAAAGGSHPSASSTGVGMCADRCWLSQAEPDSMSTSKPSTSGSTRTRVCPPRVAPGIPRARALSFRHDRQCSRWPCPAR